MCVRTQHCPADPLVYDADCHLAASNSSYICVCADHTGQLIFVTGRNDAESGANKY